ncbi:glycosyltransferase family 2 protein [Paenibacillus thalictri]|uniref:Glycosyltransferase n=1 Tax=Paenibacillus thalictri TaxID=2527873 RepID=A0A4V2J4Y8_9BACL|nr:glycosyltransferase [Paenibacillus thalictri]TBL81742.1 glycosyltransferase [Paenibacillus thalictri]
MLKRRAAVARRRTAAPKRGPAGKKLRVGVVKRRSAAVKFGTKARKRRKTGGSARSRRKPAIRFKVKPGSWLNWGIDAGKKDAGDHPIGGEASHQIALNRIWQETSKAKHLSSWPNYWSAAKGYVQGYSQVSGIHAENWVLMPTGKTVSAVLTVMNEEDSVLSVVQELRRLPLKELIVVVNGSEDQTFQKVRSGSDALVVYYQHRLGHDVGRAIGSKLADSDIILFVDGDFTIPAEQLLPFIASVDRGTDMALNNITPYLGSYASLDAVSIVKRFLNLVMGRPDLASNSLTAVPHAVSRKALETIGIESLMVPPKAQIKALLAGLSISAPWSVDVISMNKMKRFNSGERSPVADLIVGDHIEAFGAAFEKKGDRLSFPDKLRKRHYAAE